MIKPWAPHSYNRCSKLSPSSSRQMPVHCMASSRTHFINCCHSCLKSCHEIFDNPGRYCINMLIQVSLQKQSKGVYLVTEKDIRSVHNIQSMFQHMLRSTTTGHLPHSALEFCCTETIISASQLEAHLQNHETSKQEADIGPWQYPQRFQPKHRLDTHFHWWQQDYPTSRGDCCGHWTHPQM
jgi:hypothetical protein